MSDADDAPVRRPGGAAAEAAAQPGGVEPGARRRGRDPRGRRLRRLHHRGGVRAGRRRADRHLRADHQQGRALPGRLRARHRRGCGPSRRSSPTTTGGPAWPRPSWCGPRSPRWSASRCATSGSSGRSCSSPRRTRRSQRRGARYAQELGDGFTGVVLRAADAITHPDPEAAVRACFGTVFAATIIRVAYGPGFATPSPVDDDAFVADLGETGGALPARPPARMTVQAGPSGPARRVDRAALGARDGVAALGVGEAVELGGLRPLLVVGADLGDPAVRGSVNHSAPRVATRSVPPVRAARTSSTRSPPRRSAAGSGRRPNGRRSCRRPCASTGPGARPRRTASDPVFGARNQWTTSGCSVPAPSLDVAREQPS